MTANLFVQNALSRIDSIITGKLFMYSIIYSYSKSLFEQRHAIVSKIPFSGFLFGLSVSSALLAIISIVSLFEPAIMFFINGFKKMAAKKIKLEITFGIHHCAIIFSALVIVTLFFLIWFNPQVKEFSVE